MNAIFFAKVAYTVRAFKINDLFWFNFYLEDAGEKRLLFDFYFLQTNFV